MACQYRKRSEALPLEVISILLEVTWAVVESELFSGYRNEEIGSLEPKRTSCGYLRR